jgi:hypothetical protein
LKSALRTIFHLALVIIVAATIAGCGGSSSSGTSTGLAPGGASNIYVAQATSGVPSTLLQFPVSANGTAPPASTLTLLPQPNGSNYPLVFDSAGQSYVAARNGATAEIGVYSAGSTGATSPVRTILGSNGYTTYFDSPLGLAVDSSSQLYVLSYETISVYSTTANGFATPIRSITGSLTQLGNSAELNSIAVDTSGNIYVAITNTAYSAATWTILKFSSTANGNIAPSNVITATSPVGLHDAYPYLDSFGNVYIPSEETAGTTITVFAENGTNSLVPTKTIVGTATNLGSPVGLTVDAVGNIYVMSIVSTTTADTVYVNGYASTGSGNLAPAVQFTSSNFSAAIISTLAVH